MASAPKEITLSSTKGQDWDELAKSYVRKGENPSDGAVKALLGRVNARLPFSKATGILDNGCGPGVVTTALLSDYGATISDSCTLQCSDFSPGMIRAVDATKTKQVEKGVAIWSRVQTSVSDATNMESTPSESQSHIMAGWVYFLTPDPQKCLSESKRMLERGGVLGLTSWADNQWLQVMRQLPMVFPDRSLPEIPKEWASHGAVKREMEIAGFSQVESAPFTVYMGYETHAELIHFLLYTMPHMVALTKGLNQEELKRIEEAMLVKLKEYNPQEPGRLSGDAIVATGMKV